MARKSFALNTEPHVAEVGAVELKFVPEVMGDEFLDGYAALIEQQRELGAGSGDISQIDAGRLRGIVTELRSFLGNLMMPETRELFFRFVVQQRGKKPAVFTSRDEAEAHAAGLTGSVSVKDESMQLPTRVLMELLEWVAEIYGGGRPPTSSNGSVPPSPPRGTPGTGTSRSRGSTRGSGR